MGIRPKPCPFCGSAPTVDSWAEWTWTGENLWVATVTCPSPDCGFHVVRSHIGDDLCDERDEDEETCAELERRAVELWNRRAVHTDEPATGLKPCPFCGYRAMSFGEDMGPTVLDGHGWRGVAACADCGEGFELWEETAGETDVSGELKRRAVERWNRRVA